MATPERVFLDFSVNNGPARRVVFKLFTDTAPKSAENFAKLCEGVTINGKHQQYKGNGSHRLIKDFMIQFGDLQFYNPQQKHPRVGTGSASVFGAKFEDQDLTGKFDRPYVLANANSGPNTNGSQAFITFEACPWLNYNPVRRTGYQIIGEVVEGQEVIADLNNVRCDRSDWPLQPVQIVDSGILE
ncbi:hypothetical protein PCE1_004568 [Barthelona sp. PCE]